MAGAAGRGWNLPARMMRRLPGPRAAGVLLFSASLALYAATLSWSPFPGTPTRALMRHLVEGEGTREFLWGLLVRGIDRIGLLPLVPALGLFSAVCGAAGVALTAMLLMRVRYRGLTVDSTPEAVAKEEEARKLSGLVAGLYLACSIPFWVASTRTLPDAFHLLGLLLAALLFSEYQRTGRVGRLAAMGLLYGAGMTVSGDFLLFFPVAVVLLGREWLRFSGSARWRHPLVFLGCLLPGLGLYLLQAARLLRWTGSAGGSEAWKTALGSILRELILPTVQLRYNAGFFVILFFGLAPWFLLFVLSRRSPWYYDLDQILVRFVFSAGLLAIHFNLPFALWDFLGTEHLLLTLHLLLAACMGYMAGEFWILGGCDLPSDASVIRKTVRLASRGTAAGLPLVLLLAGLWNHPVASGRPGREVDRVVDDTLDRLQGRDILMSGSPLDDLLHLAARRRGIPLHMVNFRQLDSPVYLRRLASLFPDRLVQEALKQEDGNLFVERLMESDDGIRRVAILDLPEELREFGHLMPDGLLYRLEREALPADFGPHVAAHRDFWIEMVRMAEHPVPDGNPARPYQDVLRRKAAKMANNLGVRQAESGDVSGALDTFRTARQIDEKNLSVMLNLLEASRGLENEEVAAWQEEWEAWQDRLDGSRWALTMAYGDLWHAGEWVRRGLAWAMSGASTRQEAVRLRDHVFDAREETCRQRMDLAYLQWGQPPPEEILLQLGLARHDRDTGLLMELCRLALRRQDADAAEACLNEALAMGVPEEDVEFDRAMADWVRGDLEGARERLVKLSNRQPGETRAWMALALMNGTNSPLCRRAMRFLNHDAGTGAGLRLGRAWLYLNRHQWERAQEELEALIQSDPHHAAAWEWLLFLAQLRNNSRLFQTGRNLLQAQDPDHPLLGIQAVFDLIQTGDREQAEKKLREQIRERRHPDLLNILANLLMVRDGDLREAGALLEEALLRQPFNPHFRASRAEWHLRNGEIGAARSNLEEALAILPDNIRARFLEVQLLLEEGKVQTAAEALRELQNRREGMTLEQLALMAQLEDRVSLK